MKRFLGRGLSHHERQVAGMRVETYTGSINNWFDKAPIPSTHALRATIHPLGFLSDNPEFAAYG